MPTAASVVARHHHHFSTTTTVAVVVYCSKRFLAVRISCRSLGILLFQMFCRFLSSFSCLFTPSIYFSSNKPVTTTAADVKSSPAAVVVVTLIYTKDPPVPDGCHHGSWMLPLLPFCIGCDSAHRYRPELAAGSDLFPTVIHTSRVCVSCIVILRYTSIYQVRGTPGIAYSCVCVLHSKPFFLPVDIQLTQCPCRQARLTHEVPAGHSV